MAFNIRLTHVAQDDVAGTMEFLIGRSPEAAKRWLDGLFEAIESLGELPARHALIAEAARLKRPLRSLPYQSHRVVYEVDETRQIVSIVRVYHFARAPLRPEDME